MRAGEFTVGADQFRADVAVNPNDTEEAIWAFLCEAQLSSAADARERFLQARGGRSYHRQSCALFCAVNASIRSLRSALLTV